MTLKQLKNEINGKGLAVSGGKLPQNLIKSTKL